MDNRFFAQPILYSPYEYPIRHWELDGKSPPPSRTNATA
jgi:type III restriction enzyme